MGWEQQEVSDAFPAVKERWLRMIAAEKSLYRCLPVAIVIASQLNHETHCWRLRIVTLMAKTGLSRRSVQLAIADLVRAELLDRELGFGASEFTFGRAFYQREREIRS